MAAFDFPSSPTVGQSYAGYVWDGQKWNIAPVAVTNAPASSANPKLWGAAVPGAATPYSREDHVHPADEAALAYSGMQINGSMDVTQEKGLGQTTAHLNYVIDGWVLAAGTVPAGSVVAQQLQAAGGAFPGILNYLSIGVNTATTSLTGSETVGLLQRIEGFRIMRLWWGSAAAQPITIGFWSSHGIPGTYTVAVRNGPQNRAYVTTYNHAAAGVSQYNVVTIPGDTTGGAASWPIDNSTAMIISFTMAGGPTVTASAANTWTAGNFIAAPGQANGVATTSGAMRITGVVVLPGIEAPTAARSALIMRPFDQELLACMRYYQKSYNYTVTPGTASAFNGVAGGAASATTNIFSNIAFKVRMRGNPTIVLYSYNGTSGAWSVAGTNADTAPAATGGSVGENGFGVITSSGLVVGGGYFGHYTADARLP